MNTETKPVDVLGSVEDSIRFECRCDGQNQCQHCHWANDIATVRAAVAELLKRDKAAAKVFDCVLRGLNDLTGTMGYRSQEFVSGWLENWAKSMRAVGFKPTDPSARDIARALVRIGGAA